MAQTRFYSSTAQPTTVTTAINNSVTSVQVQNAVGFPLSFPFTIALDYGTSGEELCDVTASAGSAPATFTIIRGVDGTSAQSHGVGAVVRHVSSARDFTEANAHINTSIGVHGLAGAVVGTTDTQTLTNKTLVSPVFSGSITGATFNGLTWTGAGVGSSGAAGVVPLTLSGFTGQTANLLNIVDASSNNLFNVAPAGTATHTTTSTSALGLIVNQVAASTANAQEWRLNNAANASMSSAGLLSLPYIFMSGNATNSMPFTISAPAGQLAGNNLMNVSFGAVNVFNVAYNGGVTSQSNQSSQPALKGQLPGGAASGAGLLTLQGSDGNSVMTVTNTTGVTIDGTNTITNPVLNLIDRTATQPGQPWLRMSGTGGTLFQIDSGGNITTCGNFTPGAWNTYTPVWGSTGTAPGLGNGSVSGRWAQYGKTILAQIILTIGSTSTAGTGNYTLTLPATSASTTNMYHASRGTFGGITRTGTAVVGGTASTMTGLFPTTGAGDNSTATSWSATAPAAPASGDVYAFTLMYEAQ